MASDILNIDTLDIAIAAILLVATVGSLFLNPFIRFKHQGLLALQNESEEEDEAPSCTDEASQNTEATDIAHVDEGLALPPLSIIITPHQQAEALEQHLPVLLQQDYPAGYKVIVVREEGDNDTNDVLKRIAANYEKNRRHATLYVTSILPSSRFMSRKKLAITIGVKAARTPWVVLTEADCEPSSDQWLRLMAEKADQAHNLVVGWTTWAESTSLFRRYERVRTACQLLFESNRSMAYRTNGANLLFRRDDFMNGEGYRGNLQWMRGEYDFLVNKQAEEGRTAVVVHPAATIVQDRPSNKMWRDHQVFYRETRRYLQRSLPHRLWFIADTLALYLPLMGIVAVAVYAALTLHIVSGAAALVSLLLIIIGRTLLSAKVVRRLDAHIPSAMLFLLEMAMPWHKLAVAFRHMRTDKLTFTTHKQ